MPLVRGTIYKADWTTISSSNQWVVFVAKSVAPNGAADVCKKTDNSGGDYSADLADNTIYCVYLYNQSAQPQPPWTSVADPTEYKTQDVAANGVHFRRAGSRLPASPPTAPKQTATKIRPKAAPKKVVKAKPKPAPKKGPAKAKAAPKKAPAKAKR